MRTYEEQDEINKKYNLAEWIKDSDGATTNVQAPVWAERDDQSPVNLFVRDAAKRDSKESISSVWLSVDGAEELGLRLIAAARDFRARHGLPDPEEA